MANMGSSVKREGGVAPEDLIDVFHLTPKKDSTLYASGDKSTSALVASSERPAPMFYSAAQQALSKMPLKTATSEQWLGTLRNAPGLKGEELENAERFLVGRAGQQVSKDELAAHIEQSMPQIKEVTKEAGRDFDKGDLDDIERDHERGRLTDEEYQDAITPRASDTKFSEYQLPGGENYREVLMTLPASSEFQDVGKQVQAWYPKKSETPHVPDYFSSHWDEPNVLAHLRMNDRSIPDAQGTPQRTLFAEELQSDWHQAGRKQGYGSKTPTLEEIDQNARRMYGNKWDEADERVRDIMRDDSKGNLSKPGVPDAPFKKTWPELLLKRMVREAAEKGYDQIAWTDGATQAARYDLSKQISKVEYNKNTKILKTWDKDGRRTDGAVVPADRLPDYIGKEAADRLLNNPTEKDSATGNVRVLSGLDLQVGGEGMKGFYDDILPKTANKLFGKLGGKVEKQKFVPDEGYMETESEAATREAGHNIHVLKITPELRKHAIERGFPLFSSGLPIAGGDQPEYTGRVKLTPVSHDPFAGVKNAK